MKQYIIAGSLEQFRQWKHKYLSELGDLYTISVQDIVYVQDILTLKGLHKPKGRFIGTWYKRQDIDQIVFQLLVVGSITQDQLDHIITTKDKLNGVKMDLSLYGL